MTKETRERRRMPLFSKGYIIERQISKGIFRLRTHHNMGLSARETIHFVSFSVPSSEWPTAAGMCSEP